MTRTSTDGVLDAHSIDMGVGGVRVKRSQVGSGVRCSSDARRVRGAKVAAGVIFGLRRASWVGLSCFLVCSVLHDTCGFSIGWFSVFC